GGRGRPGDRAFLGERAGAAPGDDRRRATGLPARPAEPPAAGRCLAAGALSGRGVAAGRELRPRGARRHPPRRQRRGVVDGDLPDEPRSAAPGAAGAGGAARPARAGARGGRRGRIAKLAHARRRLAPETRRVKVRGSVRPPGDKSISHRALMLAALAHGTSELEGLLTGADVKSTARVLRHLGAEISSIRDGTNVTVHASRITHPASRLNCGNSGTTARLMLGILAGQRFAATLTGDASLRRRPMRRVTEPLRAMGAEITERRGDSLPLTIRGGRLHDLTYTTPVASAQIKSALLLAGLTGNVGVAIREPYRSRDHTERL